MKNKLLAICLLLINLPSICQCFTPPTIYRDPREINETLFYRFSSYPFISGNTFRSIADVIIDDQVPIDPNSIQDANIVFLKTNYIEFFFQSIHPQIEHNYILITHNSDFSVPGIYAPYLNDSKIIAWFGQNPDGTIHSKFHTVPIGIANPCYEYGDVRILQRKQQELKNTPKTHLLYLNFVNRNRERSGLEKIFARIPFCLKSSLKSWDLYLDDIAHSKFVLSPEGVGLDCYRTWEAMLLGSIPIVKSSALDSIFKDLPVLVVKKWKEVTEEYLEQKYREISSKTYSVEKLYAQYWLKKIQKVRDEYIKKGRS